MSTSACTVACESVLDLLSHSEPRFSLETAENLDRLHQLWLIDQAAYGELSLTFEAFQQWWLRYSAGSLLLIDNFDMIAGSLGIYPLSESDYSDLTSGVKPESQISPMLYDECDLFGSQRWYASGIVLDSAFRGSPFVLKQLLKTGLSAWLDSGHVRFPVKICSIAEYEVGAKTLRFLGFEKIADGCNCPDGFDIYQLELNTAQAGFNLLRRLFK
jgi:hypothetical protein